jgi:hypothetical protein
MGADDPAAAVAAAGLDGQTRGAIEAANAARFLGL